jgi:hypothetical protein
MRTRVPPFVLLALAIACQNGGSRADDNAICPGTSGDSADGVGDGEPEDEGPSGDDDPSTTGDGSGAPEDDDGGDETGGDETGGPPDDPPVCPPPEQQELCAGDCVLDVQPPLSSISGALSWGGEEIIDLSTNREWHLAFHERASEEIFTVYFDGGTSYAGAVHPGTYDVYVGLDISTVNGAPVVQNFISGDHRLATDLDVSGETVLDVEPPMVTVSGQLSWGGEEIIDLSTLREWHLAFHDTESDEVLVLRIDGGTSYSARMFPGVYDVYVGLDISTVNGVPIVQNFISGDHLLREDFDLSGDTVLDVTPPMVDISGLLSWGDGQILDLSSSGEWHLTFHDRSRDERLTLRLQGGPSYTGRMFPGVWDVYVGLDISTVNGVPVVDNYIAGDKLLVPCAVLQ